MYKIFLHKIGRDVPLTSLHLELIMKLYWNTRTPVSMDNPQHVS